MGKALLVCGMSANNDQATGTFGTLFGNSGISSTEANSQFGISEDCTIASLAFYQKNASAAGDNTVTVRKNGAGGTLTATKTGVGAAADTTHSDSFAATDLLGLAFTDTGTDPGYYTISATVEMASGHGNFHAAVRVTGTIYDVASATRFLALSGAMLPADGATTEANTQWKQRGYTSWEAMQVRATANARTNDSTIKNRINGADGTGSIVFGAGISGLLTDTGIGDSLSDGDLIGLSLTLLTGTQDLTLSLAGCTLKNASTSKSDCFGGRGDGLARAASATAHYFPLGGSHVTTETTEVNVATRMGFDGTASNLRCYLSANTYSVAATLKLFKNGSAVITLTLGAGGGAGWYENASDTVAFVAADVLSFEYVGGTSGSITIQATGVTLEEAGGAPPPTLPKGGLALLGVGA